MKVKLCGMHGTDGVDAYLRLYDSGCFSFTPDVKLASELSVNEVDDVRQNTEWYLNTYNASKLVIE